MIITTVVVHNNTIHCHHQCRLALLVLYNTEYSIATFLIKPSYRASFPNDQVCANHKKRRKVPFYVFCKKMGHHVVVFCISSETSALIIYSDCTLTISPML